MHVSSPPRSAPTAGLAFAQPPLSRRLYMFSALRAGSARCQSIITCSMRACIKRFQVGSKCDRDAVGRKERERVHSYSAAPCALMHHLLTCTICSHAPSAHMHHLLTCTICSHAPSALMHHLLTCTICSHEPFTLMHRVSRHSVHHVHTAAPCASSFRERQGHIQNTTTASGIELGLRALLPPLLASRWALDAG